MSSPATNEEFTDLKSHNQMWTSFTKFLVRGIVGSVVLILFIGFITGVL